MLKTAAATTTAVLWSIKTTSKKM